MTLLSSRCGMAWRLALRLQFLWASAVTLPFCAQADSMARLEAFASGHATTRADATLRRGMNFSGAMEAPNEGDWGPKLVSVAFRIVKEAGFDHVRIPMRISAHTNLSAPYEIHQTFLHRMDWVIDEALSHDLGVIIDMHHFEELMHQPQAQADRLVELWRQVATRYRRLPRAVMYEILNEPTHNLTAEIWNPILARTISAIRAIDNDRVLIVEGANWSSAKDLRDTLRYPVSDKNLVGSFHMYAPNYFTHQGANWMPKRFETRGVVFPGPPSTPLLPSAAALAHLESRQFFKRYNKEAVVTNPGGPAAITEQLESAREFADRTGLRVYLGEFGSIDHADLGSRTRWTRMVRTEAERHGFGWAYWDFCGKFGAHIGCGPTGHWIPQLMSALLN